jgi:hypothetical protein
MKFRGSRFLPYAFGGGQVVAGTALAIAGNPYSPINIGFGAVIIGGTFLFQFFRGREAD